MPSPYKPIPRMPLQLASWSPCNGGSVSIVVTYSRQSRILQDFPSSGNQWKDKKGLGFYLFRRG